MWMRPGRAHEGILGPLAGQANVDEGTDSLDSVVVLGMVEEEALAALICRMPVKDVESRF